MSMFSFFKPKVQPVKVQATEFSYCETVTASGGTPWHIRTLTEVGKKLGGGADTPALCGRIVSWDVNAAFRGSEIDGKKTLVSKQCIFVCKKCQQKYMELVRNAD